VIVEPSESLGTRHAMRLSLASSDLELRYGCLTATRTGRGQFALGIAMVSLAGLSNEIVWRFEHLSPEVQTQACCGLDLTIG
jgi:hypothetical protein